MSKERAAPVSFACERVTNNGWSRSPGRFASHREALDYVTDFINWAKEPGDFRIIETTDAPNCTFRNGRILNLDGSIRITKYEGNK